MSIHRWSEDVILVDLPWRVFKWSGKAAGIPSDQNLYCPCKRDVQIPA